MRHSKWRKTQTTRGFVSIGRVLLGAEQLRQDAYHPHKCAIPATPPPAGREAAGSGRLPPQLPQWWSSRVRTPPVPRRAAPVALPLVIQCQVAGRVAGRGAITAGTTGGLSVSKSYSKKGRNLLTCTLSEDLFFKGAFKVCAERVIRRCDRASRRFHRRAVSVHNKRSVKQQASRWVSTDPGWAS